MTEFIRKVLEVSYKGSNMLLCSNLYEDKASEHCAYHTYRCSCHSK